MSDAFVAAWRTWWGKPDGVMIRLRCWLTGHEWETCWEPCCDGKVLWCRLCSGVYYQRQWHELRLRASTGSVDFDALARSGGEQGDKHDEP